MKVKIGKYTNWVGPYQIADALCFWAAKVKDETDIVPRKPDWVHEFGRWLSEDKHGNDSLLTKACQWVESKKKRTIKVHIDRWDTWGMDNTLAYIILPMLKQLRETKHGAPNVDDEDVPENFRSTAAAAKENDWDTDSNHFLRWDWVLDEMIQAFECKVSDKWDAQYHSGEHDFKSVPCEWDKDGKPLLFTMERGPKDTYKCDYEALAKHEARNQNGFRLFGKYYQALWD
jgi:hypothetical protein